MPMPDSIDQGTAQPEDDQDPEGAQDLEPYWADYAEEDLDDEDEDDDIDYDDGDRPGDHNEMIGEDDFEDEDEGADDDAEDE